MHIRHHTALLFSGSTWLGIGSWLLYRSAYYLSSQINQVSTAFLFLLVIGGIALGVVKGKYVFSKSVSRVALRILRFPSPFPLQKIYTFGYCLLILCMSSIGMCFRFLPLSALLKGFLDTTIGTALVIGSLFYFRFALLSKKQI